MRDDAFETRLENWGRVYGYLGGRGALSNTAAICERLAIAAGQQPKDGYRELEAKPEVDEDDAAVIEWCWARSDCRMDARHRALLKAHYVHRADTRFTARALQIRFRSYDTMLAEAVEKFSQMVALFETSGSYAT